MEDTDCDHPNDRPCIWECIERVGETVIERPQFWTDTEAYAYQREMEALYKDIESYSVTVRKLE